MDFRRALGADSNGVHSAIPADPSSSTSAIGAALPRARPRGRRVDADPFARQEGHRDREFLDPRAFQVQFLATGRPPRPGRAGRRSVERPSIPIVCSFGRRDEAGRGRCAGYRGFSPSREP